MPSEAWCSQKYENVPGSSKVAVKLSLPAPFIRTRLSSLKVVPPSVLGGAFDDTKVTE